MVCQTAGVQRRGAVTLRAVLPARLSGVRQRSAAPKNATSGTEHQKIVQDKRPDLSLSVDRFISITFSTLFCPCLACKREAFWLLSTDGVDRRILT